MNRKGAKRAEERREETEDRGTGTTCLAPDSLSVPLCALCGEDFVQPAAPFAAERLTARASAGSLLCVPVPVPQEAVSGEQEASPKELWDSGLAARSVLR